MTLFEIESNFIESISSILKYNRYKYFTILWNSYWLYIYIPRSEPFFQIIFYYLKNNKFFYILYVKALIFKKFRSNN